MNYNQAAIPASPEQRAIPASPEQRNETHDPTTRRLTVSVFFAWFSGAQCYAHVWCACDVTAGGFARVYAPSLHVMMTVDQRWFANCVPSQCCQILYAMEAWRDSCLVEDHVGTMVIVL
jgi:hypothetical protein